MRASSMVHAGHRDAQVLRARCTLHSLDTWTVVGRTGGVELLEPDERGGDVLRMAVRGF